MQTTFNYHLVFHMLRDGLQDNLFNTFLVIEMRLTGPGPLSTWVKLTFHWSPRTCLDCFYISKMIESSLAMMIPSALMRASHQGPWTCECQGWLNLPKPKPCVSLHTKHIRKSQLFLWSGILWVKKEVCVLLKGGCPAGCSLTYTLHPWFITKMLSAFQL